MPSIFRHRRHDRLYLIPSYRRRRLAILTAVYTDSGWRGGRSDFRKSNSTPADRIYLVYTYDIIYDIQRKHTHTSLYLYSCEEWRRVCAIWILIIKISRGFDRFLVTQKRSGSFHKYFRYSLNVDDVSHVHARVLYKSLGKTPFRFSPDSVKNWTFYQFNIFSLPTIKCFSSNKMLYPFLYYIAHECILNITNLIRKRTKYI